MGEGGWVGLSKICIRYLSSIFALCPMQKKASAERLRRLCRLLQEAHLDVCFQNNVYGFQMSVHPNIQIQCGRRLRCHQVVGESGEVPIVVET